MLKCWTLLVFAEGLDVWEKCLGAAVGKSLGSTLSRGMVFNGRPLERPYDSARATKTDGGKDQQISPCSYQLLLTRLIGSLTHFNDICFASLDLATPFAAVTALHD